MVVLVPIKALALYLENYIEGTKNAFTFSRSRVHALGDQFCSKRRMVVARHVSTAAILSSQLMFTSRTPSTSFAVARRRLYHTFTEHTDHSPMAALFVASWFTTSLASLFAAKYILSTYRVNEGFFTVFQFTASLFFGILCTKVLRLFPLVGLSRRQLFAVLPLSAAFLIKEFLKYISIARISVNLVNNIRSLGPAATCLLEYVIFHHTPPMPILACIVPIVLGVSLTSLDEMSMISSFPRSRNYSTFLLGVVAALLSTVMNQSQNIYSKILFGQERIDPASLQIHLSAISLSIWGPCACLYALCSHISWRTLSAKTFSAKTFSFAMPSMNAMLALIFAGFINFLSTQLAFAVLSRISPVSYSVANTFKRVCIVLIAVVFVGEHVGPVNAAGILISILGVYAYEKVSRDYKQSKVYNSMSNNIPAKEGVNCDSSTSKTVQHQAGAITINLQEKAT